MKKTHILLLLLIPLLATSCHKRVENFPFEGKVLGYVDCTLMSASISEMDFGYVLSIITPDSIGSDFVNPEDRKTYHNCIILYRTRSRCYLGDTISGTMYLDDKYSRAYCSYHPNLGLPEGVCYTLD